MKWLWEGAELGPGVVCLDSARTRLLHLRRLSFRCDLTGGSHQLGLLRLLPSPLHRPTDEDCKLSEFRSFFSSCVSDLEVYFFWAKNCNGNAGSVSGTREMFWKIGAVTEQSRSESVIFIKFNLFVLC